MIVELVAALPLPGVAPRLAPWVTVREALQTHCGDDPAAWGRPVSMRLRPTKRGAGRHGADATRCSRPDAPAATVVTHPTAKGGQILLSQNHAAAELDAPGRAILARNRCVGGQVLALDKRPDRRGEQLTLHDVPQSARLAVVDRPSPTLDARPARAGTGNAIVLSERAALVPQGFPSSWTICGRTAKARWSQIGQAVPPAVAEAIARAVRMARSR